MRFDWNRRPAEPPSGLGVARRQVLTLGLAGLGLTGCGIDWRSARLDTGRSPTAPDLTPDVLARFAAIDALSVLRLQALSLSGGAAEKVAAAHQAQLIALGELPGPVPSGSATPTNWPTPPPNSVPDVDANTLAAAEQEAALAILPAPELGNDAARLLTSIATSALAAARALKPDLAPPTALPEAPAELAELDPDDAASPLQAVADAEDAAGFAYASYAAALAGAERARAVQLMGAHRDRSLQVRSLASSAGVALTPPPAAYTMAVPDEQAAVVDACAQAERSCAVAAAGLFRLDGAGVRPLAQTLLLAAGQAQAGWVPLPALPGLQ